MKNKKLYKKERFAGCLLGAAMGDALGYNVKNMSAEQKKKTYGKKGIVKFKPQKNQKTVRISDETSFASASIPSLNAQKRTADKIFFLILFIFLILHKFLPPGI